MGDADAGPIEDALRQPMLARGGAWMIVSRRDLRHVDDRLDPRLFGRSREDGSGFEQPFRERIREVCASDAAHGAAHRRDVVQISDDDFGAKPREVLGALIGAEDEGPHRLLSSEQLSDSEVAGRSMSPSRARDQKFCNGVLCHECLHKVVVECKLLKSPR